MSSTLILNCITRVSFIRTIMILLIGWMHDFLKDTVATCLSSVGGKPLSRKSRYLSEHMISICRVYVTISYCLFRKSSLSRFIFNRSGRKRRHTWSIDTGSPDNSETKHLFSILFFLMSSLRPSQKKKKRKKDIFCDVFQFTGVVIYVL